MAIGANREKGLVILDRRMSKESSEDMSKALDALKKKRRFFWKSVTDTLKSVDEALSIESNHATVQVLKDNVASKWVNFQEVEGYICT